MTKWTKKLTTYIKMDTTDKIGRNGHNGLKWM